MCSGSQGAEECRCQFLVAFKMSQIADIGPRVFLGALLRWAREWGRQGWQGVQTLPRVITLDYDTPALLMAPVAEVESLRVARVLQQQAATLDGPNNTLVCAFLLAGLS